MNHVNISAQALGLPDMPTSDQIRLRAMSYFNWTWCSRWAELGDEYAIQLQAGRLLAGRPPVYQQPEKFVSSSDASFVKRLLSGWCVATLSQSILGGGCIYFWPASIMLNAREAFCESFANSKAESVEVRAARKIDIWVFEIWKRGLYYSYYKSCKPKYDFLKPPGGPKAS